MSKVIINDFAMKLGFDGKEAIKGIERIEKRFARLDLKMQKSQKMLNKKAKMTSAEINLQSKLGRLEKIGLDIESKRLRIIKQRRDLKASIQIKSQQIKRATIATASAEERAMRASQKYASSSARVAKNSERTARATRKTSHHLKNSVASVNKMQNFLLKGALAYGAFQGGKAIASSTLNTGMDSSRSQVGLEAVASHIGRGMGMDEQTANQFASNQTTYARDLASSLNRDMLGTQESWRDILGATITTIDKHGEEGFKNMQDLFQGVIESSAVFKLSPAETKLMLLGTKQTMQKGKLQAEEITRQMAERSPLLMGELVKAVNTVEGKTGLVEEDIFKMMENGKLLAYDVMPELGRNLSRMARELAGGDLQAYMQKSAAGAWDGVKTSIQGVQIGIFEEMDKPLARMLSTVKEIILNMEFLWQPAGVFVSNIFDLMDDDLTKLLDKMKKGEGVFADIFGTIGGSDGFELRKENMTDEQLEENSKAMLEKSKSVYDSLRNFMVGSNADGTMGGFAGGVIDFFTTVKALLESIKQPLADFAQSMGIDVGDDGIGEDDIGHLSALWITSNLTGATSMFVAMTETFGALTKALPSLNKLGAIIKSPQLLAILGALGLNVATGTDPLQRVKDVGKVIMSEDSTLSKAADLSTILIADPLLDKVLGDQTKPLQGNSLYKALNAGGLINSSMYKGSMKPSSYDGMNNYGASHLENLVGAPLYEKSFWTGRIKSSEELLNFLSSETIEMPNAKGVFNKNPYFGMTSQDAMAHSSSQLESYGALFSGLSQGQKEALVKSELFLTITGDGFVGSSQYIELNDNAPNIINMSLASDQY